MDILATWLYTHSQHNTLEGNQKWPSSLPTPILKAESLKIGAKISTLTSIARVTFPGWYEPDLVVGKWKAEKEC